MLGQREYAVPYSGLGSELGQDELRVLGDVLGSGNKLSHGEWQVRFEEAFAAYVGSDFALSVTSGTVALEMAIQLLDLCPGDEVIVTPQTYQATIQPLLGLPVTVRFCDVRPNSLNMDVDCLRSMVNERTKAILLVHYGGLPADLDEIMRIASQCGALVIEDCAHALGAEYFDRRPGQLADIGCFSFHSSKNITTLGEGGMITFSRPDWAARVRNLRGNECDATYRTAAATFPAVPRALYPGLAYTHECTQLRYPGTNAMLSEPAAAVGWVQLGKLANLVARREDIAASLDQTLSLLEGVTVQSVASGLRHARHLYTFFVDPSTGLDRDAVVTALDQRGIQVWLRYFPLNLRPEWRRLGHGMGECPVAERIWFSEQINLPCQPSLSDSQVKLMCVALEQAIPAARTLARP